jgi:hypothetical protein
MPFMLLTDQLKPKKQKDDDFTCRPAKATKREIKLTLEAQETKR